VAVGARFAREVPRQVPRDGRGLRARQDTLYVLSGKLDPRSYRRVTEKARAEHRRIVPLRSWDDAPETVRDALKATDAA